MVTRTMQARPSPAAYKDGSASLSTCNLVAFCQPSVSLLSAQVLHSQQSTALCAAAPSGCASMLSSLCRAH